MHHSTSRNRRLLVILATRRSQSQRAARRARNALRHGGLGSLLRGGASILVAPLGKGTGWDRPRGFGVLKGDAHPIRTPVRWLAKVERGRYARCHVRVGSRWESSMDRAPLALAVCDHALTVGSQQGVKMVSSGDRSRLPASTAFTGLSGALRGIASGFTWNQRGHKGSSRRQS